VDKTGAHITGGSDWTVSSLNPLDAVEVAVTRREPGEHKGDALLPSEAVGLSTMLKAYTIGGAYSLFLEDKVGSIQVGKRADIIFLDRNLFSIPPHEIHSAKVTHTFFDGKLVYEK
jgi:predicted amidohydrolase YtcJ